MFSSKIILVILAVLGLGGFGVAAASGAANASKQQNDATAQGIHVTYNQDQNQSQNLTTSAKSGNKTKSGENDIEVDSEVSDTITSTESMSMPNRPANAIALKFNLLVSDVVQLHNSGWGFGEIYRLYELWKLTGQTPAQIQAMRDAGMGWGQIEKTLGVKHGNAGDNLGSIMSGRNLTDTQSLKKSNAGGGRNKKP